MQTDHAVAGRPTRTQTYSLLDRSGSAARRRGFAAMLRALAARPLLLATIAAICSVVLQGFNFGISNNIFHIPIVLRFYDMPQFAHDAYVQSLRNFVSPVYGLLALAATEHSVGALFLASHLAARILTFHALLRIVLACGVAPGGRLAVAAASLTLCRCINSLSPVGADEMLANYFTHSQVAQALALYCLAFLLRGRFILAALMAGLTFDVNAFVGVWVSVAISFCAWRELAVAEGGVFASAAGREVAIAAGVFAAFVVPEMLWIHAVVAPQSAPVDYREFLLFYYGKHFFLAASTWSDIARDGAMAVSGLLALRCMRAPAFFWLVWAALTAVFVLGGLTDPLTTSRLWLGLHLLRVDGLVALLTAALLAASACQRLDPGRPLHSMCAGATLAALISGSWPLCALAVAALAISLEVDSGAANRALQPFMAEIWSRRRAVLVAGAATLGVHAAATGYFSRHYHRLGQSVPDNHQLAGAWPLAPEWREAGLWARAATAQTATFLVPTDLDGFRIAARRSTSMTWKEGGAVMWAPGLYQPWLDSMRAISALHTSSARIGYACRHGFSYVVEDLRAGKTQLSEGRAPAYANRYFAVIASAPCRGAVE